MMEEEPEIPKNLLPVFITAGTVDSTLCGWVYFHDTDKKEIEETEEKDLLKPIFASKSHIGAINCTDSYGKVFSTFNLFKGKMCVSGGFDETICVYDMVRRIQNLNPKKDVR
jgi:hypothetical protein